MIEPTTRLYRALAQDETRPCSKESLATLLADYTHLVEDVKKIPCPTEAARWCRQGLRDWLTALHPLFTGAIVRMDEKSKTHCSSGKTWIGYDGVDAQVNRKELKKRQRMSF